MYAAFVTHVALFLERQTSIIQFVLQSAVVSGTSKQLFTLTRLLIARSKENDLQRKASVFNEKSSSALANGRSQRFFNNCLTSFPFQLTPLLPFNRVRFPIQKSSHLVTV